MRNIFDKQLVRLNNELIEMGSLVEQSIETAVEALVKQDVKKAKEAIRSDDKINHQEKEIENLCLKLLLEQQPVAKDLRLISAVLKMITDLERIGDHAADISEITITLAENPYVVDLKGIQKMAKETMEMIIKSIEAFVNKDLEIANEVIRHDDVVDDLFKEIKKTVIKLINENPEDGEQVADILMIAKYFERIGDHATNIAEWVIFSITGKHQNEN